MKARTADTAQFRVPTAAQIAKKVDELVAEYKHHELAQLRAQFEGRAMAALTEELNRDAVDDLITDQARSAGYSFVRDVWPDHPAATHMVATKIVGESTGTLTGGRTAGARPPFRLADDGVWFGDYWVCSPLFPAGRLPEGGIAVAFKVADVWRTAVPGVPDFDRVGGGGNTSGYADLRGLGLRMNTQPLRGRPELEPAGEIADVGDQFAAAGAVRTSADLLYRFIVATQNEAPWNLAAS